MKIGEFFDKMDKMLSPSKQVTAGEDAVDSLVIFAIIGLLLYAMFK